MTLHAGHPMRPRCGRPVRLTVAVCAAAWAAACGFVARGEDDQAVDDVPPGLQQLHTSALRFLQHALNACVLGSVGQRTQHDLRVLRVASVQDRHAIQHEDLQPLKQ